MTVKVEFVDGSVEFFQSEKYRLVKENLHPLILTATVFDNGKKVGKISRKFKWYYKNFAYYSPKTQATLKQIQEEQVKHNENNENAKKIQDFLNKTKES